MFSVVNYNVIGHVMNLKRTVLLHQEPLLHHHLSLMVLLHLLLKPAYGTNPIPPKDANMVTSAILPMADVGFTSLSVQPIPTMDFSPP